MDTITVKGLASDRFVTGMALSQFVYGAERLGVDTSAAMKQASLTQSHLTPTAQVPEALYERLVLNLAKASQTDSFGAELGQHLMLPLYGPLMTIAMSSPSLGEALNNLAKYFTLSTGNCGGIDYRKKGNVLELSASMTHKHPALRRYVSECVLVLLLGIIRLLTSKPQLLFDRVWIEHAPYNIASARRLEAILGCPVEWNKRENRIFIDETASLKISGHGQELLHAAELQAQQQLEKIEIQTSWLEKIRWHTRELILLSTPRRETVADRLMISTRTLDRRLKEFELTWQQLVDAIRWELAKELLADKQLTVAEITKKLGFSDSRSFQRRFKSWTGKTPSSYRSELRTHMK